MHAWFYSKNTLKKVIRYFASSLAPLPKLRLMWLRPNWLG
jgi:hypothetical protein